MKNTWKRLIAVAMSMLLMVTSMHSAPPAIAEGLENMVAFTLTCAGSPILGEGVTLSVTDGTGTAMQGSTTVSENYTVQFIPDEELTEGESYTYRVEKSGYQTATGTFIHDGSVVSIEIERAPVQRTYLFTLSAETSLPDTQYATINVYSDAEKTNLLATKTAVAAPGIRISVESTLLETDMLYYTCTADRYEPVEGSYTVGDTEVPIQLVRAPVTRTYAFSFTADYPFQSNQTVTVKLYDTSEKTTPVLTVSGKASDGISAVLESMLEEDDLVYYTCTTDGYETAEGRFAAGSEAVAVEFTRTQQDRRYTFTFNSNRPIANDLSVTILVFDDAEKTNCVFSVIANAKDGCSAQWLSPLWDNDKYYYTCSANGYEDAQGSFNASESDVAISLQKVKTRRTYRFTCTSPDGIDPSTEVSIAVYEDSAYSTLVGNAVGTASLTELTCLTDLEETDTVYYLCNTSAYIMAGGSFRVSDSNIAIELEMITYRKTYRFTFESEETLEPAQPVTVSLYSDEAMTSLIETKTGTAGEKMVFSRDDGIAPEATIYYSCTSDGYATATGSFVASKTETHAFCTACGLDLTATGTNQVMHAISEHGGAAGYANKTTNVSDTVITLETPPPAPVERTYQITFTSEQTIPSTQNATVRIYEDSAHETLAAEVTGRVRNGLETTFSSYVVDNAMLYYTCEAAGYEDASGTFTASDSGFQITLVKEPVERTYRFTITSDDSLPENLSVNVKLYSNSAHTAIVSSGSGTPATGVTVTFTSTMAESSTLYYVCTANGYDEATGSFKVSVTDRQIKLNKTPAAHSYAFTFNSESSIKDSLAVSVKIYTDAAKTTLLTSGSGTYGNGASLSANTTLDDNTTLYYTCTADGCDDAEGTMLVSDTSVAVTLTKTIVNRQYAVTFTSQKPLPANLNVTVDVFTNEAHTARLISGSGNASDGLTLSTQTALDADTVLYYTCTADQYDLAEGTFTVGDTEVEITLTRTKIAREYAFTLAPDIAFPEDLNATVTLYTDEQKTTQLAAGSGKAASEIVLSAQTDLDDNDALYYTCTADGYDTANGTCQVSDTEISVPMNKTVVTRDYQFTFTADAEIPEGLSVSIYLYSDPEKQAQVLFGEGTAAEGVELSLATTLDDDAVLYYTCTADGFENAEGSFSVADNEVAVSLYQTLYDREYSFSFTSSEAFAEGLTITVNVYSDEARTKLVLSGEGNASDTLTLTGRLPQEDGDMLYVTASADKYDDAVSSFTAETESVTLNLEKTVYTRNYGFTFTSDNRLTDDMTVSAVVYTDSARTQQILSGSGKATEGIDLTMQSTLDENATLYYDCTLAGFEDVQGTFRVSDTEIAVTLVKTPVERTYRFTFTSDDTLPDDLAVTVKVYTDSARKNLLVSTSGTAGAGAAATASTSLDDDAKLYYEASADHYETQRGTFTVTDEAVTIQLSRIIYPAGPVTFESVGNVELSDAVFTFTDKNGSVNNTNDGTTYTFPDKKEEETIQYTVNVPGYIETAGEIDLTDSAQTVTLTLTPKTDSALSGQNVTVTYGDPDFDLFDYIQYAEGYDGELSVTTDDGDAVTLSDTTITIIHAGSVTYTITAPETDTYLASETTVVVTVEKKALGTLKAEDFTWTGTEKEFDNSKEFTLSGTLVSDKLLDGDSITLELEAEAEEKNAGTWNGTITRQEINGAENYAYTIDDSTTCPELVITKQVITISANKISANYGSDEWTDLCAGNIPSAFALKDYTTSTGHNNKTRAIFEALDLADYLHLSVAAGEYPVGTEKNAVSVIIDEEDAGNFLLQAGDTADLVIKVEVTEDDLRLWSRLQIDEDASEKVYVDTEENVIYIGKDGKAVFLVSGDDVYDSVAFKMEGSTGYSAYINGQDESNDAAGSFYLYKNGENNTRTDADPDTDGMQDNNIPNGAVVYDADAPEMTLDTLETQELTDDFDLSDLPYSVFTNTDETEFTFNVSEELSGLVSAEYLVIQLSDLDENSLNEYLAGLEDDAWTSIEDGGKITVPEQDTEPGESSDPSEDTEGVYLIILRASDKTGNESLLVSNAAMIDHKEPEITLTGIDPDALYNGDIPYTITLKDNLDFASGIASVSIELKANGKLIASQGVENGVYVGSAELDEDDMDELYGVDKPYTAEAIEEFGKALTVKGRVPRVTNTSSITLTITASDRAGNTASISEVIGVDTVQPKLLISYDDNAPVNGTYFNHARTMTVAITERRFKEDKLVFRIGVDGARAQKYSVDDIRNGAVPGMSFISATTASGSGNNNTRHDYVFIFGENGATDHDYTISAGITDFAGNSGEATFATGTQAGNAFTIDEIIPMCALAMAENGTAFQPGASAETAHYVLSAADAVLTMTERNPDYSTLTAALVQKDADGNDVSAYGDSSLRKLQAQNNWTSANGARTFRFDVFDSDARYALSVTGTDKAGNAFSIPTVYFTVDGSAPEATILVDGTNSYNTMTNPAAFGYFSNQTISVSIAAKDSTSGLKSLQYYLYDPGDDAGSSIAAPSRMEDLEWQDYTTALSLIPDSQALVYVRAEDAAGNVAYINTQDGLVADQTAPTITVTADSNVKYRNESFTISFTVNDPTKGGTHSGLYEYGYSITASGTETASDTFTESDPAVRKSSETKTVTINAADNNSNNVVATFRVKDQAGNETSIQEKYIIDTTAPVITASYDNNTAKNGKYFASARTMNVRIQERNYDESRLVFHIGIDGTKKDYSIDELLKGAAAGITAERGEDSESQIAEESRTDSRTISYVLHFGADGSTDHDYSVEISATDLAGNTSNGMTFAEGTVAGNEFTIDEVAPLSSTAYTTAGSLFAPGSSADGRAYSRSAVESTLSVQERNLDYNSIQMVLTQTDVSGNAVSVYSQSNIDSLTDRDNWTSDGSAQSIAVPAYTGDANYCVSFAGYDLAGNAFSIPASYFTIDSTVPGGNIVFDDGSSYAALSTAGAFRKFRNTPFAITIQAGDATAGVKSVKYYTYIPTQETRGTFALPVSVAELEAFPWADAPESIAVNPNLQAIIYIRVEDNAGNIAYYNTQDGIVADNIAPVISFDQPESSAIANADVSVPFSVFDPVSGGTYSGIREYGYRVYKDGEMTQSGGFDNLTDPTARVQSGQQTLVINAAANNSNNIIVELYAVDYSGNNASVSRAYQIDVTAPDITASYDKNNPVNGRYFNSERTMTVSIRERNYTESGLLFTIGIDGITTQYSYDMLAAGQAAGVTVARAAGTQDDVDFRNLTDDRTHSYILHFGADGQTDHDYTVDVQMTDPAGNISGSVDFGASNPARAFTIDEVAPTIRLEYFAGGTGFTPGRSEAERTYTTSGLTANVVVTERNFSESGLSLSASGTNAEGEAAGNYTPAVMNWSADGSKHIGALQPITGDANYTMSADYTDLAGNKASYAPVYMTVDKTAPEGSVTVTAGDETGTYGTYSSSARFWFYTKNAKITKDVSDETSGIESVSYLVYVPDKEARNSFDGLTVQELNKAKWTNWSDALQLSVEQQAVIYARITDKAGNTTYINTADGIVIDTTAPSEPEITITLEPSSDGFYNKDVPFGIIVKDPLSGGTYAGLKTVMYEVLNGSKVTQSGDYNDKLNDRTARVQSLEESETVDAELNNSNTVTIRVTATDYAGNTASAERELKIDITEPKIEIVYDHNDGAEGRYYNDIRTATVKVTERNFDPQLVDLKIVSQNGTEPEIGNWTLSPDLGTSDDAVSTCIIRFVDDDDYTVSADMTDMAGNKASTEKEASFTIDRTEPIISVLFDNNNVRNGKYYKAIRTATVRITEHNFSKDKFESSVTAVLDGKAITAPAFSEWETLGDTHTTTITFEEDGEYSLTLNYTDMANNRAKEYSVQEFVLDTTAPVVTIGGVEDKMAYNTSVEPVVTYTDRNHGGNIVTVKLSGARHATKDMTGTITSTDDGGRFKMADFLTAKSEDDVYTMTATFVDLAGNETSQTISFSINRFGSNYTFSKETAANLDRFFLQKGEDFVIFETNVDTLLITGITIALNGNTRTLERGKDYQVEEVDEDKGWKVYRYTIFAQNFEEDGVYEIQINSMDAAGNDQNNQLKDAPITFAIDTTNPSVVITGIKDNGRYTSASVPYTVTVSDNLAMSSVAVYVDGELVAEFDAEEIKEAGGKLAMTLDAADDFQTVTAVAYDAAGNKTESDPFRVLVTTNPFTQFVRNKPLMIGSIIGLAGLLAFLLILLLKRRKKDEDAEGQAA